MGPTSPLTQNLTYKNDDVFTFPQNNFSHKSLSLYYIIFLLTKSVQKKKKKTHSHTQRRTTKMEATKTIAHEIGGIQNDALRFGLHGVKSDIVGSHPLESAYQSVN